MGGFGAILIGHPCIASMRGDCMKSLLLIPLVDRVAGGRKPAQTRIFRCGNEYTNNATEAQQVAARWWMVAM
jgi:hypothetical protein